MLIMFEIDGVSVEIGGDIADRILPGGGERAYHLEIKQPQPQAKPQEGSQ